MLPRIAFCWGQLGTPKYEFSFKRKERKKELGPKRCSLRNALSSSCSCSRRRWRRCGRVYVLLWPFTQFFHQIFSRWWWYWHIIIHSSWWWWWYPLSWSLHHIQSKPCITVPLYSYNLIHNNNSWWAIRVINGYNPGLMVMMTVKHTLHNKKMIMMGIISWLCDEKDGSMGMRSMLMKIYTWSSSLDIVYQCIHGGSVYYCNCNYKD